MRGAGAGGVAAGCRVPGPASFDVEGVDAPGDDVERIGAAHARWGLGLATTRAIQSAMSAVMWVSWAERSGAELVEEHVAGRRRCGRGRPTPARPVSWSTTTIR